MLKSYQLNIMGMAALIGSCPSTAASCQRGFPCFQVPELDTFVMLVPAGVK